MKVLILSPEKTVYEGEAITLLAPGLSCLFQVLDHHISIITFLTEGLIKLQSINHYFKFYIKNGILKAKKNKVIIIYF